MSAKQQHPFHLVELSPWPIITAFSLMFMLGGTVMIMHGASFGKLLAPVGLLAVVFCVWNWWSDVIREGLHGGHHNERVRIGLRIGMSLFILSEVMFFFAFFFSFFYSSLFPLGILEGPWDIPFINTLILLLSGTTVTWAHYALEEGDNKSMVTALGLTVCLGALFTCLQAYEYHHAAFALKDGVYAANFYLATGFHGLHVIIGTIFLLVCYFRAKKGQFTHEGHLGFEFAAWYWHFVDVVWLFLFVFVYVLGR